MGTVEFLWYGGGSNGLLSFKLTRLTNVCSIENSAAFPLKRAVSLSFSGIGTTRAFSELCNFIVSATAPTHRQVFDEGYLLFSKFCNLVCEDAYRHRLFIECAIQSSLLPFQPPSPLPTSFKLLPFVRSLPCLRICPVHLVIHGVPTSTPSHYPEASQQLLLCNGTRGICKDSNELCLLESSRYVHSGVIQSD